MKKLTIKFANTTTEARSEANMWNILRGFRDKLATLVADDEGPGTECPDHALVTDEAGNLFKEIVFRLNSHRKIEMVNLVKATCRRAVEKARKAAKEAAEKEAAKKARKAEANRRYRERKKAAATAAAVVPTEA